MAGITSKDSASVKPLEGQQFQQPQKVSTAAQRKALKEVDKKLGNIAKDWEGMSVQLEKEIESIEQGISSRSLADLSAMQTQIMMKQSELIQLGEKLTGLTKYKQTSKLAMRVIQNRRRMELLEQKRAALSRLQGSELPKTFQLKKAFNAQLEAAVKEKKFPAQELYKAVKIYSELHALHRKPGLSQDERNKIGAELKVMRLKMTAASQDCLKIGNKEQKLIQKYESRKDINSKDVDKLREGLMKLVMAEKFFPLAQDADRYNTVNRWLGGLYSDQEAPRTRQLIASSNALKTLAQLHSQGVQSPLVEFPGEGAFGKVQANPPLEDQIQSQSVSKKQRKWTKVSTGVFDSKNKSVKKLARDIESLGVRCLKTSKYMNTRVMELSAGRAEIHDLQQEIVELKSTIAQAEQKLLALREAVASHGYDKMGAKLERIIAKQSHLVDSLKRKHAILSTYAQPQFFDAVLDYNAIISCASDSLNEDASAGYKLFEAHHKLENLRDISLNLPDSSPIKEEVDLLLRKAENVVDSAVSQGALKLSKKENRLLQKLAEGYSIDDLKKLTSGRKSAEQIAAVLSKQLTEAMYYYRVPLIDVTDAEGKPAGKKPDSEHFEEMMTTLESLAHNLTTLQPKFWEDVLSQNESQMGRIIQNYNSSPAYRPERAQGVKLHNEAVRYVQNAVKESDSARVGVHLAHALNADRELMNLRIKLKEKEGKLRGDLGTVSDTQKSAASEEIANLGQVHHRLTAMARSLGTRLEEARPRNKLTKHKAKLRQQLLDGSVSDTHTSERTRLIVTREIAKGLFSENPIVLFDAVAMLETIGRKKPALLHDLGSDQELQSVAQDAVNFLMEKAGQLVGENSRGSREALVPIVDSITYLREHFDHVSVSADERRTYDNAQAMVAAARPARSVNPYQEKLEAAYSALQMSEKKGNVRFRGDSFVYSKKKASKEELQHTVREVFQIVQSSSAAGTGHQFFERDGKPESITKVVELLARSAWGGKELAKDVNKPVVDAYVADGTKMISTYMPQLAESLKREYAELSKGKERAGFLIKLCESQRMISAHQGVLSAASPVQDGTELKEDQAAFVSLTHPADIRNDGMKEELDKALADRERVDDASKLEEAAKIREKSLANLKMVQMEIYSTEKSFSQSLSLFAEKKWPVKGSRQKGTIFDALEGVKAITSEEKEVLSQGWEELAGMSGQILKSLEGLKADSSLSPDQKAKIVHDTFTQGHIDDFLNLFAVVSNNQMKALEIVNKAQTHPEGKKLLSQFKNNPTNLDMASILIQPVQRAPRYVLLLRENNKFCDRAGLHPAGLQRLQGVLSALDARIKEISNLM